MPNNYTEKDQEEDYKHLAEFEKIFVEKVGKIIPIKKFKKDSFIRKYILHSSEMFYFYLSPKKIRIPANKGTLFLGRLAGYIFLSSGVNPNGLDRTGRVARDWTVSFEIKGTGRPYRCKTWDQNMTAAHYYHYTEDPKISVDAFVEFLESNKNFKRLKKFITTKDKEDGK